GETDGAERIEAHTFWSEAIERLAGALGDITAAGVAFPVDLRLRPGSKGSGFASSVPAAERYYAEYGDLWERQTLTRSRICWGDARLARRVRAMIRHHAFGAALGPRGLKEIAEVRTRMELELGKETPGRLHVKFGRGGLARPGIARRLSERVPPAHHGGARGVHGARRVSRFCVVDGHSHLFRAYHAVGYLSTSKGVPSHAVLILSTMLWKLIREEQP